LHSLWKRENDGNIFETDPNKFELESLDSACETDHHVPVIEF